MCLTRHMTAYTVSSPACVIKDTDSVSFVAHAGIYGAIPSVYGVDRGDPACLNTRIPDYALCACVCVRACVCVCARAPKQIWDIIKKGAEAKAKAAGGRAEYVLSLAVSWKTRSQRCAPACTRGGCFPGLTRCGIVYVLYNTSFTCKLI